MSEPFVYIGGYQIKQEKLEEAGQRLRESPNWLRSASRSWRRSTSTSTRPGSEHLLASVGEVLGEAVTPEVAAAWSQMPSGTETSPRPGPAVISANSETVASGGFAGGAPS